MGDFQNNGNNSFYNANNQQNPNKKKPSNQSVGLKMVIILVSVVCVFIAFVVLGYVFFKNSTDDKMTELENSEISSHLENSESSLFTSDNASDNASNTSSQQTQSDKTNTGSQLEVNQNQGLIELSSEDIAQKVMPSIVGIVVYEKNANGDLATYSTGSGIIMTEDGYIITNAHVILNQQNLPVQKVEVYLNNDETYLAKIIGYDVKTDLAVIDVESTNLIPAEFGDSKALKVGEKAIAIGNPSGLTLSGSFTQGVISGVDRQMVVGDQGYSLDYIQTDAAINPGNSGGALVNKYGQVVGVNSSKIADVKYEGLGFAIPMHEAKDVVDSLIANGYVKGRPRLGITFTSITDAMADVYKVPSGMRVVSVDKTTDAFKQGVLAGDIITHVNGKDTIYLEDVTAITKNLSVGDSITLTIYRIVDSKEKTIDISIKLSEFTE